MLHITNGDSAAHRIRASGVEGMVVPWREVLHEGPVPGGLSLAELSAVRARFIADEGWGPLAEVQAGFAERDGWLSAAGTHREVVLWFEHDLYDQLELIQLLDWFADHPIPRLTLVNPAEYLGLAAPERLAALFAERVPVTDAQLALGRRAWAAFREPTPEPLAALLEEDSSALRFLAGSVRRLLEQLPGADDGLSRSERQVLEALMDEERTAGELFQMHNALEEPVWLGDSTFVDYLRAMAAEPLPLLHFEGSWDDEWHRGRARLTDTGRRVLAGEADAVALRGVDRWQGGVQLKGTGPVWRWDRVRQRLARR
jgi:hypothetical protein